MKAFKKCRKRFKGECSMRVLKCEPGQEINTNECFRMCKEGVRFLQCSLCGSELWFDIEINGSGTGSLFFCPVCNKDVSLANAIQSLKLLNEKLKENQRVLSVYKKLALTPRGFDIFNKIKKEDARIKKMINDFKEIN